MAMTANSSQNHKIDTVNSPQKQNNLPSLWAQVVRGESESIPPLQHVAPSSPEDSPPSDCSSPPKPATENSSGGTESSAERNAAAATKKAAWKMPNLNGLAGEVVVSPVMGAVSWPSLPESTNKASVKSSSPPPPDSSLPETVSDGSSTQAPVTLNSPQKQSSSNAKPNSTAMPARQRSMKRGGGGHPQSSFTHPSQPPPSPPPYPPVFAVPPYNSYGNMLAVMPDQSPRPNSWEPRPAFVGLVPPPLVVNDHRRPSGRGGFRPQVDSSERNNSGGRRDRDHGHYGNARDIPAQPQRSPRGFIRPLLQNSAPFVPSQPARPIANSGGYPELFYFPWQWEHYLVTPAPGSPVHVPAAEQSLPDMLVRQIEYYFSDANLVKDDFLKSNMDGQGWVPVTLIAGFNRVRKMTDDIHLILDSLRSSTVLEVQDDKVRRHNDWMKWVPSSSRLPSDSAQQVCSTSSQDLLTNSIQKITLGGVIAHENSTAIKSASNSKDASVSSFEPTLSGGR